MQLAGGAQGLPLAQLGGARSSRSAPAAELQSRPDGPGQPNTPEAGSQSCSRTCVGRHAPLPGHLALRQGAVPPNTTAPSGCRSRTRCSSQNGRPRRPAGSTWLDPLQGGVELRQGLRPAPPPRRSIKRRSVLRSTLTTYWYRTSKGEVGCVSCGVGVDLATERRLGGCVIPERRVDRGLGQIGQAALVQLEQSGGHGVLGVQVGAEHRRVVGVDRHRTPAATSSRIGC